MEAAAAPAVAEGGGACVGGGGGAVEVAAGFIIRPTEALMEEAAADDDNVVDREGGKLSIELNLGNTVAIETEARFEKRARNGRKRGNKKRREGR